jgi:hypothetical protein
MTSSRINLASQRARLRQAATLLRTSWIAAGRTWTDSQHQHLNDRFIQPLEQAIRTAECAIKAMDDVLRQAQHDCGDEHFH